MCRSLFAVVGVAVIISTAFDAYADSYDERTRLELARHVVELEDHRTLLMVSHEQTTDAFADMFAQMAPDAPDGLGKIIHEIWVDIMRETQDDYVDAVVRVYADVFSLRELKVFAAFYESPDGTAVRKKMPEFTRAMSKVSVAWQTKTMPLMIERLTERFDLPANE